MWLQKLSLSLTVTWRSTLTGKNTSLSSWRWSCYYDIIYSFSCSCLLCIIIYILHYVQDFPHMLSYLTSFLSFSTVSWKYIPVFTLCVKLCHPAMFCLIFLPVFISVCQTLSSCHVLVGLSSCLHSCVSCASCLHSFLPVLCASCHVLVVFLPVFIHVFQTLCFLSSFLSSCLHSCVSNSVLHVFILFFLASFMCVKLCASCHVLVGLSLCLHSCVSNSVLPAMFLVGLSSCLHSFLPVFIPLCQTLCFLSCFGWSVFFLSSCNMFLSSLLCVKLCFLPYIHWSVFSCTVWPLF